MNKDNYDICELCGRKNYLNFHHFIPRTLHTNKWFKKHFTRKEMSEGINVCKYECHREIHVVEDNKTLGKEYNTLEKLLNHPILKKYVKWVRKKDGIHNSDNAEYIFSGQSIPQRLCFHR